MVLSSCPLLSSFLSLFLRVSRFAYRIPRTEKKQEMLDSSGIPQTGTKKAHSNSRSDHRVYTHVNLLSKRPQTALSAETRLLGPSEQVVFRQARARVGRQKP